MIKIGIIGLGVVGSAICDAYPTHQYDLVLLDPAKGHHSSWDRLYECEGIFICVPSPSLPDGSCDASILKNVLSHLENYRGVIISKVTATPDIYEALQKKHDNLVYSPEFLTAANAKFDYVDENWGIFGGAVLAYQREAARIVKYAKPNITVRFCSIGEAALHKYIVNSFLATKVVFMNEMHDLAEQHGYSWQKIAHMMQLDNRIGPSHTSVPGHDSYYGFGGMCFPKDTSALLKYAKDSTNSLSVLSSAVNKNSLLRLKNSK